MSLLSQSSFARQQGWSPSYVTQLKREGRLVIGVGGLVDVENSLRRIAETADPSKDGVTTRHARNRASKAKTEVSEGSDVEPGEKSAGKPGKDGSADDEQDEIAASYSKSRAIKEHFAAQSARLSFEREAGKLCETADVLRAGASLGVALRTALESLPDQIAPELAPLSDVSKVHALLVERVEGVLNHLSVELSRLAETVSGEKGAKR